MRIILNGKPVYVENAALSYAKVCRLAELAPERNPSVTYRTYAGAGGTLAPGDVVGIAEGLIINACYTGSA